MTDESRETENWASQGRPEHGGLKSDELRALGLKSEEVLDFSASVSPIGPPVRRVGGTPPGGPGGLPPTPRNLVLREAISNHLSEARAGTVGTERILAGNGSTEIIHLLARAYLSPPRPGTANTAFLFTPTYGEYAGACAVVGAATSCLDGRERPGFRWDLAQAARRIVIEKPSLVFLCNPNNPTGVFLEREEVLVLAEATYQAGGLLVLDEAYISFAEDRWESLGLVEQGAVLVLRSMTKDYALTALRVGYSVGHQDVTARLDRFQPDWSVNRLGPGGRSRGLGRFRLSAQGASGRGRGQGLLVGPVDWNGLPGAAFLCQLLVGAGWRGSGLAQQADAPRLVRS